MQLFKKVTNHPFFIKLFNWEYWPFNLVYGPIYLYWLWLCIRARAIFFFNTSNPSIKNGGFLLESKKEIYDLIPPQYYPCTILLDKDVQASELRKQVKESNFIFSLIAKPDIGMRGLAVQKVETIEELLSYAKQSRVRFLVQQFIPLENEVGIFYYRLPGEKNGHITGIVGKEFLTVTGDGSRTIEALLSLDKRFILQLKTLKESYGNQLQRILLMGEKYLMVPYGNHSRGAKFLDITHLVDEKLILFIDGVCQQIPGFYYGRMDIRYNTWEELKQGKNFSIIELNGAGSEPTHIYDPNHSIFFAWKEIIRHWNILLKVSMLNHHSRQIPYMSILSGLNMFLENSVYVKLIQPPLPANEN